MKILSYYYIIFLFIILSSVKQKNYTSVNQFVLLSASEPYIVYLPLIVSAWNDAGFVCIIVLTYYKFSIKFKFIKRYILMTNSIVVYLKLGNGEDIDIVSRLARIFSFIDLRFNNSTLLMTADVDILPIDKKYFKCGNKDFINIKSYGVNGYGVFPANKRWAMSYIMMSLKNWIEILKNELKVCNSILTCVKIIISDAYKRNVSYYGGYYGRIDEVYMRDRIRNSSFFPSKIIFDIHGSYGRKPCSLLNSTNYKDIHLPRIKEDNEWIKYVYCLINNFKLLRKVKNYINDYCKFFRIHNYTFYKDLHSI